MVLYSMAAHTILGLSQPIRCCLTTSQSVYKSCLQSFRTQPISGSGLQFSGILNCVMNPLAGYDKFLSTPCSFVSAS